MFITILISDFTGFGNFFLVKYSLISDSLGLVIMIHLGVPLPEIHNSHRTSKLVGWKTSFLSFWVLAYFQGQTAVSF